MRDVANVTYDFSGQVVLITGAARGQGENHALCFARAGASVVVSDIGESIESVPYGLSSFDQLNEVAAKVEALGVRCQAAICDVRNADQVQTMVDDTVAEFGGINVLVNNAGIESVAYATELTEQAWDDMIDIHLKGSFLCSKAVAAHMIDAEKGGRIVNIGSVESLIGLPRQTHYCAAKHGVIGFSKALALELAAHGITVNVIAPGGMDTPMTDGLLQSREGAEWLESLPEIVGITNAFNPDMGLDPQEISNALMWLASDAAKFVTGSTVSVDAGWGAK